MATLRDLAGYGDKLPVPRSGEQQDIADQTPSHTVAEVGGEGREDWVWGTPGEVKGRKGRWLGELCSQSLASKVVQKKPFLLTIGLSWDMYGGRGRER